MWTRKRTATAIMTALLVAGGVGMAEAQGRWRPGDSGSVRVLLGEFSLEASDQYWDDKFMDFTGSSEDFDDTVLLVDYRRPLGGNAAFLFGGGWYEGAATQAYRDWEDASGRDIAHRTTLNTAELTGAVILELGGRRGSIVPYVGIGGGYLWWELTEEGSFIDFDDPDLPVVDAGYRSSDGTFEVLALAGLDIRIGDAWSLVFQGRWREADDELGQGLAGLGTLDLSGVDLEGGIAFHF